MTRLLRVVVNNWPLKVAAIGLATLLYGGLVLSQNTLSVAGPIQIEVRNQPDNTFLLTAIPPLTEIRYVSPSGARAITSTFEATIDLANVTPGTGSRSVAVAVRSIDPRITVLGFEPAVVAVEMEPLETKSVNVTISPGTPPSDLQLGPSKADPAVVNVSGPKSVVDRVVGARVNVVIQPSGVDVDQLLPVVPIDALGDAVSPVSLDPSAVHVTIPVFSNRQSRTLPVSASVTGTAAPGFQITDVTIDPPTLTVEGDADQLAALLRVDTAPIPITGVSSTIDRDVGLALPTGVVSLTDQTVHVTIKVEAVTETRSYTAGLRLVGARPDLTYTPAVDRVVVTIAGSPPDLDRLTASGVTVDLAVGTLGVGTADITPSLSLPVGLTLVGFSPPKVQVTITASSSVPPSTAPSASGG